MQSIQVVVSVQDAKAVIMSGRPLDSAAGQTREHKQGGIAETRSAQLIAQNRWMVQQSDATACSQKLSDVCKGALRIIYCEVYRTIVGAGRLQSTTQAQETIGGVRLVVGVANSPIARTLIDRQPKQTSDWTCLRYICRGREGKARQPRAHRILD